LRYGFAILLQDYYLEASVMSGAIRASDTPFAVEVERDRNYFWCACGRSNKQPFCDGSHQGTGISPVKYQAKASGKVFFCGCKASQNAPLCDGSHKSTD
jgi:CDGSH-type Zn-finger protein